MKKKEDKTRCVKVGNDKVWEDQSKSKEGEEVFCKTMLLLEKKERKKERKKIGK